MIENIKKTSKSVRCFSCRTLGRKCQFTENDNNCDVCIRRNINCIRIHPKNFKQEIIKLTDCVKSHESRISALEKRVNKLEKNELLIKQNISQLYTIMEE